MKNPPASAGDTRSIPGSGRSPGEGNGTPVQCSCLENPMDRGAWWATVHSVTRSQTRTEQLNPHTQPLKRELIILVARPSFPTSGLCSESSHLSPPDLDYSGAWGDSVDCDTQEARHGHTGVRGAVRDVAWLTRPWRRALWQLHPQPVCGGEISTIRRRRHALAFGELPVLQGV